MKDSTISSGSQYHHPALHTGLFMLAESEIYDQHYDHRKIPGTEINNCCCRLLLESLEYISEYELTK